MDRVRIGLSFRALRIRRGWRQIDLAERAGVSASLISSIERGGAATVALATLVRVAAALDARLDFSLRWRGEQLDRLLDAAHARLVESTVRLLERHGWKTLVEVSFAIQGERGSIDVLAQHVRTGQLLVVEVKSIVPDNQAMLYTLDRKVRLAPRIAAERGWPAELPVSRLLVVGDGSTARRRVDSLAATYGAALPDRGASVRSWIRMPVGQIRGLLFLPFDNVGGVRRGPTGVTRVRGPNRAAVRRRSLPSSNPGPEWEEPGREPPADPGEDPAG